MITKPQVIDQSQITCYRPCELFIIDSGEIFMKLIIGLICVLGLYQSAFAMTLQSAYRSNLCMDVNAGDPASWRHDTNIEVWPCHGQENQQFSLQASEPSGDILTFTLRSMGKCLDVDMGYMDYWTHQNNVQLFTCNAGLNQKFTLQSKGGGWFMIRSMLDGRCLDIDLNVNNDWRYERNVQLWKCTGEPNQLWKFEDFDSGNGDIIVTPRY
jgi:hypothetical protein